VTRHDGEWRKVLEVRPSALIIEPVWDYVDRKLNAHKVKPRNLDELWDVLQEEWANIDRNYICKLYASVPHCVDALV